MFETGQERRIRHFGKAAEIPEFPAQAEKKEQKGSGEKIYHKAVRKSSKINGFRHLTNAYLQTIKGG